MDMFRLLAFTLLAVVASPSTATIFDNDDRITLALTSSLRPVGTLTGGIGVVYGSGFLIGVCTVLTVRHNAGSVQAAVGRHLIFRSGTDSSDGVVVAAGPPQIGPTEARSITADWMIIKLDKCLGRKLGFLRISGVSTAFAGQKDPIVEDAGFPRDRVIANGITVDPKCRIAWVGRGSVAHDCATLPGNSGGPILTRDSKGWVAIGINAAGWDRAAPETFSPAEANIAIDIGSLSTEICSALGQRGNSSFCAGHNERGRN